MVLELKGMVQLLCKKKRKFTVDLNGGDGHPVYLDVLLAFGLSFSLLSSTASLSVVVS